MIFINGVFVRIALGQDHHELLARVLAVTCRVTLSRHDQLALTPQKRSGQDSNLRPAV